MNINSEEQQYVNQQSLLLLVSNLTKAIYAFPITASILTFLFWPYVDHTFMLLWMLAVVMISIYRAVIHQKINSIIISSLNYQKNLNFMLSLDFLSGLILGLSGYFLASLPQEYQWLLIVIAATFSMNSVAAQSSIKISVLAFNIPLYISFIYWLLVLGHLSYYALTLFTLIHAAFLSGHFKAMHSYIYNSLQLTFSNQQLANDLAKKNTALKKSNQQVKAASLAKSQFIAQLSHQLKDPLQGIMEQLNHSDQLTNLTEMHTSIKTVQLSGMSLLTLLNDLIDVNRLEKGLLARVEKSFDVRKHFDDLAELIALSAENKKLFFYCDIADDVPSKVISDPLRLSQITLNLLANAIKFTHTGEVGLTITYQLINQESWLIITVIDTGQGIDETKQNYIFQPFVRGESSLDYIGNGLGLSISQELSKLLGGNISVISAPEKGSIFSCKVPVQLVIEKERFGMFSKQKILLIESNMRQRQALIHQLTYLKKSYEIAENAKEAMAICASNKIKYQAVIIGHQNKLQQKLLLNLCDRIKLSTIVLKPITAVSQQVQEHSKTIYYPVKTSKLATVLDAL